MNETKRIIIEFGARRQQFKLTDRQISISTILHLINNHFGIKIDQNSTYTLQMYDKTLNEYCSVDDNTQIFNLMENNEQLYRFRIISKSLQSQKHHLLDNLHLTAGKLYNIAKDIDKIQNLVGTLNHSCDLLNQLMNNHRSKSSLTEASTPSSYLFNPSMVNNDIDVTKIPVENDMADENFDSVSCYDSARIYTEYPSPPIPTIINLNKQQLSITNDNIQTRIIPCKYAVRGTCRLGDKCSYLHDEACIRSAREWERRL